MCQPFCNVSVYTIQGHDDHGMPDNRNERHDNTAVGVKDSARLREICQDLEVKAAIVIVDVALHVERQNHDEKGYRQHDSSDACAHEVVGKSFPFREEVLVFTGDRRFALRSIKLSSQFLVSHLPVGSPFSAYLGTSTPPHFEEHKRPEIGQVDVSRG